MSVVPMRLTTIICDSASALGALLIAAMLLWAPRVKAGEPGDDWFGKVIRAIDYASDQPVDRAHYDRCVGLKPGDILTRTGLKSAIQALYDTGSFSEISAAALTSGDGVGLKFHVTLSSFFNRFQVTGLPDLGGSPAELMSLPVGERFSEQRMEEARQTVLDFAHGKGFFQAKVEAREWRVEDGRKVDVVFEVDPGKLAEIGSMEISGAPPQELAAIRDRLDVRTGQKYERDRLRRRLEELRGDLVSRGFLEAEPSLSESYSANDNSVRLRLTFANFGQVRIAVDGFKIPREQLRRLLPVLSGEGLRPELLQEGMENLRGYLEDRGYPEASLAIEENRDSANERLVRYVVERGRKVKVSEVIFRGNSAFTSQELLRAVQLQPSRFLHESFYSVAKLDSDVESLQTLYRSAGFLDASVVPLVESLKNGERLRVVFDCDEGDRSQVRSVEVSGNRSLPTSAITARMGLKEGSPYSPSLGEHDRQVILAAYNDAGFLQPVVTWEAGDGNGDHAYAVHFRIEEGVRSFVDQVIVLGRDRTRVSVVEKRLKLRPDDPLSLGRMLDTQQALYNTGVFDTVRVSAQNPESSAPYQNVIVRLQEARPVVVRYGIGYQEREKVRGILEVSHLNIFGLGRRVDLRMRGSTIEQAAVLSFQQPQVRFLPVDSYFTLSGSKKQEISFDSRRLDMSYQYSQPISSHSWGMLRGSFTNVRVSEVPPDLAREETPRNLTTVSAFYVNDTRDNYLDPDRGFFTSTNFGVTAKLPARLLASGFYVSLFTQNSYYRSVAGPVTMAASLRFGLLHGFSGDRGIPISERFFAGGGSNLRGFEVDRGGPLGLNNEPIGGNALVIGNLELRVPLVSRLGLSAFYDGGNVYSSLSAIRLSEFSHTVGAGFRIRTPFGPIRLDYGLNLNLSARLKSIGYKPGHFFFVIGPSF